eukprot:TRINITY_DN4049_c0_g1_i6.p1 TRINITY_DN4049_c0_g1~~TRINITY_DN4049_c0_g1_i6.p1  ORF type:complete len:495 (+),score=24.23 TRINITY_DN4049_c0_g1_i6:29-1486(+)
MHILAPVKRSLSKHIQTLVKCTAEQVASISTAQQEIPIPNAYTHSAAQVSSVPSIQGEEKQFMREAAEHFINYAVDSQSGDGKVVNLVNPNQMKNEFRQHGCAIELDDLQQPCDKDVLLSGIQQSLKFCVNTRHPLFFNQLYACSDVVSTVGDWLATVVNTNVHTFEVAPVFTVVEVEVLSKIARVIGGEYAQVHDGLFAPGGSIANLYGMHIARNRVDPDFKTRGASGGPNVVALTSAHSHYSYKKSAILTGVGLDNLIAVKCDERGAMIPEELDAAIEKSKANGQTPFFVGATAGTTVLGACDPFIEIADVCKKHGLWLHVDGCWGGSAIISPKYKHLVDGMNRADSISWNFHKWLGQPTQCSAFVSKHANILKQTIYSNPISQIRNMIWEIKQYNVAEKPMLINFGCPGKRWEIKGLQRRWNMLFTQLSILKIECETPMENLCQLRNPHAPTSVFGMCLHLCDHLTPAKPRNMKLFPKQLLI